MQYTNNTCLIWQQKILVVLVNMLKFPSQCGHLSSQYSKRHTIAMRVYFLVMMWLVFTNTIKKMPHSSPGALNMVSILHSKSYLCHSCVVLNMFHTGLYPLQWCHNGHDSISNHQPHDSTVHSGADQRKHQSSPSLAFVRGIHGRLVNSPHKGPVTWKMFPFDDIIMIMQHTYIIYMMLMISWIYNWNKAERYQVKMSVMDSMYLC